jgi:hypothetical protein
MPKSTGASNAIVNLIYSATTWANVAVNATVAPLTAIFISLHTASLTPGGSGQNENETAYTNYARQSTPRSTGWDAASGGETANAGQINFPQCGVTGATLTHVATGTAVSGAGAVFHYGALNSPLAVANGITPQFAVGALTVTES